jgi:transposase
MAIADKSGLPISIVLAAANPHEVRLVETTIAQRFTRKVPRILVGDRAYDSDKLDGLLRKHRVRLVAPHKLNRVRKTTQDGRELRRYRRRWKIERLNAWLKNYRKLNIRYERKGINFLNFAYLAVMLILLRNYF